jgi:putative ABC transport system permease protein
MKTLLQDLHYGFRVLRKNPGFTAISVFSLALGIGINTAIFTLVNTILLGSLPYPDPDRVVAIATVPPQHPDKQDFVSVHDFMAWKDRNRSFDAMGAVVQTVRDFGAEENGTTADRIQGENVTPGLLQALGTPPMMGRLFVPSDDEVDHAAPVVILSYRLWQRRFGGDRNILNHTVLLNGVTTQIVGVMPPRFRVLDDNDEFWTPIPFNSFQLRGSARFMTVIARLIGGASVQQAQADITAIAGELAKQFPGRDTDHGRPWGVRVQSIREALYGFMSRPLLLLQGAVGFVLLIACANVAALLLARASSRHSEVAIRSALGAGRAQIVRQFLAESLLLSLLGGAFGVLLAYLGIRALVTMAPPWFPRLQETVIDGRVLSFSAALSLLTGLVFGVGPAMQGSKSNFAATLKDSVRGGTSGAARHRLRGALVTVQLSLALVLLIGAGLLIRSFLRMQGSSLGYDPNGLLTFGVQYPEKQFGHPISTYKGIPLWEINSVPADTISRIFDRIQRVPGVQSAGGSFLPPLVGALTLPFEIEGRPSQNADALSAEFYPITSNYFNTMKIAILRGRDFTPRDTATTPWVAIVNETMARRFFPNENPLGKRIKFDLSAEDQPREVIAVVHDMPSTRLQTRQEAAIFVPFAQMAPHIQGPFTSLRLAMTFVVRTAGEPMALMPAMRKAVREIDPNRPLVDPKTVEQYMAEDVQYPRYYSMLLSLFAGVAMALAAVGIYGVMAYAVAQRTREIGIRMALGAAGRDVSMLIVRQALPLVLGGLVLGLAGAAALTRFLSSELWEVTGADPATFTAVSIALICVAAIACMIPTYRAVRVDPLIALRHE